MFNLFRRRDPMDDFRARKNRKFSIGGSWGDAIQWSAPYQVCGWKTPMPSKGDFLTARMKSGKAGVFQFTEVRPCGDPPDMFFADVAFRGYDE